MTPQDAWNAAYNQLELQLDRASFDTWLRPAVFLGCESDVYIIGIGNPYARDMLQYRLYRNIHRVLADVIQQDDVELRFVVHKPEPKPPPVFDDAPAANHNKDDDDEMPLFKLLSQQQTASSLLPNRDQLDGADDRPLHQFTRQPVYSDLPESDLNPRYTFERFIVNRSNQVVYEAAQAVAEYPATVYNPFFVYGGVGLGKTHLLQAIAHICEASGLRTLYIPSEVFTNDLIRAIRERKTAMFRDKYRTVDVLLVDDIQFIGGKESTQEEFFHTFNALVNFNKQIVLASDRHPRELATLEDRLRSRFQGGLVADVQPPEYETRVAILRAWAQERSINLKSEILHMVAERAPNNVRELEGVFNQIVAQTRFGDGVVALPRAETTVERYNQPRERWTLAEIIDLAARKQNLTADDLIGKRRTSRINVARQIAMYIARELTECSLPQIGEAFGGRSHTTVLHGCKKIEDQIAYDKVLESRISGIIVFIKKHGGKQSG